MKPRLSFVLVLGGLSLLLLQQGYAQTCQELSDEYGIFPGESGPGLDPGSEEGKLWASKDCKTAPAEPTCQELSDEYGTHPGNWGKLDKGSYLGRLWSYRACRTAPVGPTCQELSDKYGTRPGDWGKLDSGSYLGRLWSYSNCKTAPARPTCQELSDTYGMFVYREFAFSIFGMSEGLAPGSFEHKLWRSRDCDTAPARPTCQELSDKYDIFPGYEPIPDFNSGTRPGLDLHSYDRMLWTHRDCRTAPARPTCQELSDKYGTYPGNWGKLNDDSYLGRLWSYKDCKTRPDEGPDPDRPKETPPPPPVSLRTDIR